MTRLRQHTAFEPWILTIQPPAHFLNGSIGPFQPAVQWLSHWFNILAYHVVAFNNISSIVLRACWLSEKFASWCEFDKKLRKYHENFTSYEFWNSYMISTLDVIGVEPENEYVSCNSKLQQGEFLANLWDVYLRAIK